MASNRRTGQGSSRTLAAAEKEENRYCVSASRLYSNLVVKLLIHYSSSLGGYVFSFMLRPLLGRGRWETAWNPKGMVSYS
jgi:hypothetical protein